MQSCVNLVCKASPQWSEQLSVVYCWVCSGLRKKKVHVAAGGAEPNITWPHPLQHSRGKGKLTKKKKRQLEPQWS